MTVKIVFTNIIVISKKFDRFSLKPKYSFLANIFNDLDKFTRVKTQKEKRNVYDTASELYNDLVETYFKQKYFSWFIRC